MRLTRQLIGASQLDLNALVAVLEAEALHVRPVVVPHHSHLQLGGHLQGHPCTLLKDSVLLKTVIVSSLLRSVSQSGLQAPGIVCCERLGKNRCTV